MSSQPIISFVQKQQVPRAISPLRGKTSFQIKEELTTQDKFIITVGSLIAVPLIGYLILNGRDYLKNLDFFLSTDYDFIGQPVINGQGNRVPLLNKGSESDGIGQLGSGQVEQNVTAVKSTAASAGFGEGKELVKGAQDLLATTDF